jgi:hypothetical protein
MRWVNKFEFQICQPLSSELTIPIAHVPTSEVASTCSQSSSKILEVKELDGIKEDHL